MSRSCLLLLLFATFSVSSSRAGILTDTTNRNSLLYNGVEYTRGNNFNNETPFFLGDEFLPGEIFYTGNIYKGVQLQYDCIDDMVLQKDPIRARSMVFIKEKVEGFTIAGHHFIKLDWLGSRGEYFEQLYKGKRSVLVKWKKNVVMNLAQQENYVLVKTTYLLEGKTLTKISKASELTNLMGDKKRKMQQYYRDNNLSFRHNPEAATLKMVQKAEGEGW